MHSSTPDNTKKSAKKSNTGSTLRIVNVNFQSIKTKQGQLYNMLDSIKPDIICGTETWIDNSIKDSQIFPPGYNIYRNDRNLNGGGVLLAVRGNLISSPVPELQTDCEIIWCKLELVGHKAIYLTSYYNPKTSNEESYSQFEISMNHATSIKMLSLLLLEISTYQAGTGKPINLNLKHNMSTYIISVPTYWMTTDLFN